MRRVCGMVLFLKYYLRCMLYSILLGIYFFWFLVVFSSFFFNVSILKCPQEVYKVVSVLLTFANLTFF